MAIRNKDELLKVMSRVAKNRIESAARSAQAVLKEEIDNTVYSWPTEAYNRTGQFLDSVLLKGLEQQGSTSVKETVYFEPDVMKLHKNKNNWGTHIGFGGEDMRAQLPNILDEGATGGKYNREGYGFMNAALSRIDEEIGDYVIGTKKRRFHDDYQGADFGDERTFFNAGITIKKRVK